MRALAGRRPEMLLMVSLIFAAAILAYRSVQPAAPMLSVNAGPAPAPVSMSSEQIVGTLQERIRQNPDDTAAYAQLGLALLQRVRETADPNLYAQAEQALDQAIQRDPQQLDALIGQGQLALARHHFADALEWGQRASAVNPYRAQVYGIIGDAQVELGRYEEASATVQKMVDTRPDINSYSRASYIRELNGDTAGAIELMRLAASSGPPAAEGTLWTNVQLGNLQLNSGDTAAAEATYARALSILPDYAYAFAGLAKVRTAQGHYAEAINYYKQIVERLPNPEFVIALGELYQATGQDAKAQEQFALVEAMQQLNEAGGMNVDLELALFNADHGADKALALQRARDAYASRPGIYGADALAWALYANGEYAEAQRYSAEALRLGTRDAALHYHAGMIALKLGDSAAAREHLNAALAINPRFSVLHAPAARAALENL